MTRPRHRSSASLTAELTARIDALIEAGVLDPHRATYSAPTTCRAPARARVATPTPTPRPSVRAEPALASPPAPSPCRPKPAPTSQAPQRTTLRQQLAKERFRANYWRRRAEQLCRALSKAKLPIPAAPRTNTAV
jgi:hypothetical protein